MVGRMCSMANTSGGVIILGLKEEKDSIHKKITGFSKVGFRKGKEDEIGLSIGENVFSISPVPTYDIQHIPDGELFYSILKIKNETSKKPFFIKNKGQCYVRIDNSSKPAPRSTIMNLFGMSLEQKKNLQSLRSACGLAKESIIHIIRDIYSAQPDSTMKIPYVDLNYLRNTIISCDWFLKENNFWGEHTSQSGYSHGINSVLHQLDLMNTYISSFNDSHSLAERDSLKGQLSSYSHGSSFENGVKENFDKIIKMVDEFFEKQK
jgi:hypothetical protein